MNVQHKSLVKYGMGEVFECLLQMPRQAVGAADCSTEHHGGALIPQDCGCRGIRRGICVTLEVICASLEVCLMVYKGRWLLL